MKSFIKQQWSDLCERTRRSAKHYSESNPNQKDQFMKECDAFCNSEAPENYSELLDRTTEARDLAMRWMNAEAEKGSATRDAVGS